MIPPLALLVALDVGAIVLAGLLLWIAGASGWPLAPLAFALALSSMCLMLAWVRGGARFVSFGSLVRIPAYILWKLPLYIGLAREGAPKEWTRTKRD
jgi:hypothetical protein